MNWKEAVNDKYKYAIVLDSKTCLRFTELAWGIVTHDLLSESANPNFSSSWFAPLDQARINPAQKSIWIKINYVFDPGLQCIPWITPALAVAQNCNAEVLFIHLYFLWKISLHTFPRLMQGLHYACRSSDRLDGRDCTRSCLCQRQQRLAGQGIISFTVTHGGRATACRVLPAPFRSLLGSSEARSEHVLGYSHFQRLNLLFLFFLNGKYF